MINLINKLTKKLILPLAVAGINYINVSAQTDKEEILEWNKKLDSLQTTAIEKYKEVGNLKDCFKQKDVTDCSYSALERLNASKKSFEEYLSFFKGKKVPRSLSLAETNTIISKEKMLINGIDKYLGSKTKEGAKQCVANYSSLTEYLNNSIIQ